MVKLISITILSTIVPRLKYRPQGSAWSPLN